MAKRIRVTVADVVAMSAYLEESNASCGVALAGGLTDSRTVEELYAMRRAAEEMSGGIVTAISTQKEPHLARNLKKAGFKKTMTFKNYSTGNTLTLWVAKVLRNLGKAVEKDLADGTSPYGW